MALDINTGYNNAFKTFVDFAEQAQKHGHDGATAKVSLSSRTITVASVHLYGGEGVFTSSGERAANNATRASFRAAIIDMFGGEDNIPPAVKDAMKLADYGKGKPLTARRILAVKTAIDGNNATLLNKAASQAAAKGRFHFAEPEVAEKALELGFSKGELSKLARATSLYAQASGKSEMEAMREVATSGSKANRLMNYGGRFLENAGNFKAGLRQLDAFADWFADVRSFVEDGRSRDRTGADTSTKVNIHSDLTVDDTTVKGLEMVVFREIADNPAADLQAADPEELFGMKNNAAMRFYGRNMHESMLGTVVNLPPEKRSVLFAAADLFLQLYESQADITAKEKRDTPGRMGSNNRIFAARVLNHIDELTALTDKGQLTAKNVIKTCFPDIGKTGDYDLKTLNNWFAGIDAELDAAGLTEDNPQTRTDRYAVQERMATTGCTLKEAMKSLHGGPMPPIGAYQGGYAMELRDFPGGGFDQMKSDLRRVDNYGTIGPDGKADEKNLLIPAEECNHSVMFPDGTFLKCGAKAALKGNVDKCAENVRKLCGEAHALQAQIVGACLSQSANGPLKGGLAGCGLYASEHAALDYSLSKDDETGAVTIRYESPSRLPVRFSWTCTVNVDGSCVTTPLTVNADMRPIDEKKARAMIVDSEKTLGLEGRLDDGWRETAVQLLMKHGKGLHAVTSKLLANYIVDMLVSKEGSEENVEQYAKDMKSWRMFSFGDQRLAGLGQQCAKNQNGYMRAELEKGTGFSKENPDIFSALRNDADRADWNINGKKLDHKTMKGANDVIDALRDAVPNLAHRKAISTLLHQGAMGELDTLASKVPMMPDDVNPEGVALHEIEGATMCISRDVLSGKADAPFKSADSLRFGLNISEDGKTAYLTVSKDTEMVAVISDKHKSIGTATITQRTTLDLSKEIPEVTDVTFAQEFSADKVTLNPPKPVIIQA